MPFLYNPLFSIIAKLIAQYVVAITKLCTVVQNFADSKVTSAWNWLLLRTGYSFAPPNSALRLAKCLIYAGGYVTSRT